MGANKKHKEVWKGWNTSRRLAVAGFLAPSSYILHCGTSQPKSAESKQD